MSYSRSMDTLHGPSEVSVLLQILGADTAIVHSIPPPPIGRHHGCVGGTLRA